MTYCANTIHRNNVRTHNQNDSIPYIKFEENLRCNNFLYLFGQRNANETKAYNLKAVSEWNEFLDSSDLGGGIFMDENAICLKDYIENFINDILETNDVTKCYYFKDKNEVWVIVKDNTFEIVDPIMAKYTNILLENNDFECMIIKHDQIDYKHMPVATFEFSRGV